jgi:Arc/MetJ-type ribon-helix-helix transcriptional regulator
MHADLAAPQLQYLQAVVASGRYRDETDALNEAVRLLQRRDELRALLEQGERELDEGLGIPGDEVFARLELRAAELDRAGELQG